MTSSTTPGTSPGKVADLPIDAIEAVPVVVPLKQAFGVSHFELTTKACVFVRVHGGGLVGETYAEIPHSVDGVQHVASIVMSKLAAQLKGADALRPADTWRLAAAALRDLTPHNAMWGRMALGLVDAALWDLFGKAFGAPLWQVWGGARDAVPVLRIGGYYGTEIPTDIGDCLNEGVAGIKFKVGGLPPLEDAWRTLQAREVAPDGFHIAPDANCGWTNEEAHVYARALGGMEISWFEEPSNRVNSLRDWHDLRVALGVSVAGGQSEIDGSACVPLLTRGAVDVCNFDAMWGGGPSEWLRLAAVAELSGARMAHHQQPQVAAHLIAAVSGGTFVETYSPDRDPIWWNAIANRPGLANGELKLSKQPGYGWEFDWDWLDHYSQP